MNAILWYVKYAHAFCFAIISRYVGVYMIEVHCSVPGKREFVVIHGFRSNPRFLIAQARPETGGWGEQRNISLDQGVTTRCMKPGTWTGWISEYDSNEDSDDSDDGSERGTCAICHNAMQYATKQPNRRTRPLDCVTALEPCRGMGDYEL